MIPTWECRLPERHLPARDQSHDVADGDALGNQDIGGPRLRVPHDVVATQHIDAREDRSGSIATPRPRRLAAIL